MSTAVLQSANAPAPATLRPRNDVNVLHGVTWEQYCDFRDDPANNGIRMTYADGVLLLMTVGYLHERIRTLISLLLSDWLESAAIPVISAGQWTLRQALKKRGLESDNCYYISNLHKIEGNLDIDLEDDPPPDLAIEVDITTKSAMKFAVYASLQVPEIWVWQDSGFHIYRLRDGEYHVQQTSEELPGFPLEVASRVILEHATRNDLVAIQAFREQRPI